jgi:hypothetical protein
MREISEERTAQERRLETCPRSRGVSADPDDARLRLSTAAAVCAVEIVALLCGMGDAGAAAAFGRSALCDHAAFN